MKCYICRKEFDGIVSLVRHFKRSHFLAPNDYYKCAENGCCQSFHSLASFRRHVLKLHVTTITPFVDDMDNMVTNITPEPENIYDSIESPIFAGEEFLIENNPPLQKTDLSNLLKEINELGLKFALSLHSLNNINRKNVHDIIQRTQAMILKPVIDVFKTVLSQKLNAEDETLNELIPAVENIFDHVKSEFLLQKALVENDLTCEVQIYTIDNKIEPVYKNGVLHYNESITSSFILPLKFQFKKYFETPNNFKMIMEEMEKIENSKDNHISNFIQGDLWKTKKVTYPNDILVPYFLYSDDAELNNPLGSHAGQQSICFFYYSFPCLPNHNSKSENVFLAAAVKTRDIKEYGPNKCLQPLVSELIDLEVDGLNIKTPIGDVVKVKFILGLLLGDNLALNTLLGFNASFSSNKYCRLCSISKSEAQNSYRINNMQLRSKNSYDRDLLSNNPSETGIRFDAIWNKIPSYHVTDNFYVDVMHDIFEGVCHYNLSFIINYFIRKKFFDLDTLNFRKRNYNYGKWDIDSISNDVKSNHLIKKHFKMSASEMMCFCQSLPLMICDLIPTNDAVWKFLLTFIELIDILLCFNFTSQMTSSLENKIELHNELFLNLFKEPLKPKFHNLLHYSHVVRMSGPLRQLWCFKYENKHRDFKIYSHSMTSRKNLCLSIARKYQLKFAGYICGNHFSSQFFFDQKHLIEDSIYESILKSETMRRNIVDFETYSKCQYNGYRFESNTYIAEHITELKIFLLISIVRTNTSVMFFGQKISRIKYMPASVSYALDMTSLSDFEIIELQNLIGPPIYTTSKINNQDLIRLKSYFKYVK